MLRALPASVAKLDNIDVTADEAEDRAQYTALHATEAAATGTATTTGPDDVIPDSRASLRSARGSRADAAAQKSQQRSPNRKSSLNSARTKSVRPRGGQGGGSGELARPCSPDESVRVSRIRDVMWEWEHNGSQGKTSSSSSSKDNGSGARADRGEDGPGFFEYEEEAARPTQPRSPVLQADAAAGMRTHGSLSLPLSLPFPLPFSLPVCLSACRSLSVFLRESMLNALIIVLCVAPAGSLSSPSPPATIGRITREGENGVALDAGLLKSGPRLNIYGMAGLAGLDSPKHTYICALTLQVRLTRRSPAQPSPA
eukprot:COSAG05_NODE_4942_length_1318_cov_10.825688_1_plen_312_part_10